MRGFVPPDPETNVSQARFAVVYVPRRSRNRFAASCVQLCESREEALASCDRDANRFAAQVLGPSKSTEGQFIYYLVDWL
jgi:hypothetical protein